MNQKKYAVWITMIFLLAACTGVTPPDSPAPAQAMTLSCPDSLEIQGNRNVEPGGTTSLAVAPTVFGWQYQWTTVDMSLLSTPQESITEFTAPTFAGMVEVTVVVTAHEGCAIESKTVEILVANPPTFTPAATNTAQPTNTPTSIVAATNTPSIEPSATNTLVPTAAFTHTSQPTPLPSHTPSPTVPAFTILLQEPKDDTCVGSDNAVFQWLATRPLNTTEGVNGEYFALNIWAENSPVYSVSWIKSPRYEIENVADPIAVYTEQINCSGDNGCFWNVDLIVSRVEKGSGWLPDSFTKVYSSPARWFCTEAVNPPIPPTNTPAPPPQPTPVACPPDC
ncbi:MAG: hypothetical protein R3D55_20785 [Chloroflexota bacterium]